MNVDHVRSEALRLGYHLKPIAPTPMLTSRQVAEGINTSRLLAEENGLKIGAASMRMQLAERAGLIRVMEERTCSSGSGVEAVWEAAV